MDLKNIIVAFFILVILLVLISLMPTESQTGHFIMPSIISLEIIILIMLSIIIIFVLLINKKSYYPFSF